MVEKEVEEVEDEGMEEGWRRDERPGQKAEAMFRYLKQRQEQWLS